MRTFLMPLALALAVTAAPTAFAQSPAAHHRQAPRATTTANGTIIPGVVTPDPSAHDTIISPPSGLAAASTNGAANGTAGTQAVQWGRILGGVPGSETAHGMTVFHGLPASQAAGGGRHG